MAWPETLATTTGTFAPTIEGDEMAEPAEDFEPYLATAAELLLADGIADSDDAAMSFRDHAASHSGLIPPPRRGLRRGVDVEGVGPAGQA